MHNQSRRLMIADDEFTLAKLLGEVFTSEGYSVDLAFDGLSAVELIENTQYEAIISDFVMPYQGGLVVLVQAMLHQKFSNVIVISGHLDDGKTPNLRGTLMKMGIREIFAKPVDLHILIGAVDIVANHKVSGQCQSRQFGPLSTRQH